MSATRTTLIAMATLAVLLAGTSSAEAAKELWEEHCASCHGADGKAGTKTGRMLKVDDLTSPEVRAKFDRQRMVDATKNGVPKEEGSKVLLMPGYSDKLTDEQIGQLIDYIENDIGQ